MGLIVQVLHEMIDELERKTAAQIAEVEKRAAEQLAVVTAERDAAVAHGVKLLAMITRIANEGTTADQLRERIGRGYDTGPVAVLLRTILENTERAVTERLTDE